MGKFWIQADKYFNNKQQLDSAFGDSVVPVSMNGGLVLTKTDKWGVDPDCTEQIEDNIRERFGLVTPDDGDE